MKGFKLQEASPNGLPVKYVGRASIWGNPFRRRAVEDIDNEELVRLFRRHLAEYSRETLLHVFIDPLIGYNLACWCPLDVPCHADVWLALTRERVADLKHERAMRQHQNSGHIIDINL